MRDRFFLWISLALVSAACGRSGLTTDGILPAPLDAAPPVLDAPLDHTDELPAPSPYCSAGDDRPSTVGGGLIVVAGENLEIVDRDGKIRVLAAFAPARSAATNYVKTSSSIAVERYDTSDGKNQTANLVVLDRSGEKRWERALEPGFSGEPLLGGILSDGTVILDTWNQVVRTKRVGPTGERTIATGARTVWVDGDWVLLSYDDTPPGQPNGIHYEWRNADTNAAVSLERGWAHKSGRMFVRDPATVALFSPGSATPSASVSLLVNQTEKARLDATDGGGDLLFPVDSNDRVNSIRRVWRVSRDLSSAALLDLGTSVGIPPVLRGHGEMISVMLDYDDGGPRFQGVWSKDVGKTFSEVGVPVWGDTGAGVVVRGKTAAVTILEGFSFVAPPVLQILYGDRSVPLVMRASERPFSSAVVSPDGECLAYFERTDPVDAATGTWQLVIRSLGAQRDSRPSITFSSSFPGIVGYPLDWWE
jgi:hypothetical protein